MFAVCNASVPLAELELESLFWPARRQRYKQFLDSLLRPAGKTEHLSMCFPDFADSNAPDGARHRGDG